MKYPQLVSMPSAVQDWLDEQLEARGIDAVVYTRYVLSLLQRDTLDLPDDLLTLSSHKSKEIGRRGRKRGRNREEYWNVWDCEQLKRTAAVECLMSASDQKCGIEKLVDELCAKLKEIQSEGENSIHLELSEAPVPNKQTQTPSLQDQVQKYYAAFPPLNSKFAESSSSFINIVPEPSSAWSGKKVLANSFGKNKPCNESIQETSTVVEKLLVGTASWAEENKENREKEVGRENMKSRNQMKEKLKGKKETSYGFAWNMAGERNEGFSEFCLGSSESTSELMRVFQYNRQNQVKLDGNMTANELKEENNVWDSGMCRRLYERQAEDETSVYAGSVDQDDDGLENSCGKEMTCNKTSADGAEDQNLAQLIAKFDHSIEALWNPDDAPSTSPDNISSDDAVDCDQDLPMDFKQLLSSPSEQYVTVELYNLNNKRNPCLFSSSNSFIQCGTNITSSIWSDQPSQENSIDQDDYGMDCMQIEQQNIKDEARDEVSDERKLTVLLVGEEKVVGSKLILDDQHAKGDRSQEKDYSDSLFKNSGGAFEIGKCSEEKSKFAWNKYESFPSLFANVPWSLNYSLGEVAQNTGSKTWSEVENTGSGNYSLGNLCAGGNGFSNANNNSICHSSNSDLNDSLNTLNHNREDSSFTEVIPKHNNSFGKLQADKFEFGALQPKKANEGSELDCQMECKEDGNTKPESEKEEEDLLTSTRTHFRPIRMEGIDSLRSVNASNNNNNNNVGSYADGTTFVIPTSLEEVVFRRSESGALYLEAEAEAGLNSPNKYMEYKEKEVYGFRHHNDKQAKSSLESGREFIPKFKVRQNEKCCQTEEIDEMMMHSDDEVDLKRSRQEIKVSNDPDDFYFPDDDHFAEKIINCLEDNCETKDKLEHGTEMSTCTLQKEKYVSDGSTLLYYKERSESLDAAAVKQPICKCGNDSQQVQMWEIGWPKTTQVPKPDVWESAANKSQSWYNIWKSSPSSESHCHCGMSPLNPSESQTLPTEEPKTNECEVKSLQYSRLREELTMEGEQLMSDLSYMQHLYQGSDWQDETVLREISAPGWKSNRQENEGDRKLHCLSPAEDSAQEMLLYAEDAGCTQSLPASQLLMKEGKSEDDFDSSCHSDTFPKAALLSKELEAEWKLNERPFNTKAAQKDRKRRHSASQRTCSYYFEGSCRRPHCRFSHDLATVPCRFWADKSCLKGNACPFLHGSTQALRPVTL